MKNRTEMRIYLDDFDDTRTGNQKHYLYNIIDFVIQYRFQGGPEQPLRYLEMKVDKNNIDDEYPDLMHSVVEGKTRLLIDAVDKGTFIITKIWLTDNEYDLVATGIEITLNTATLTYTLAENLKNIHDPPQIVKAIFDDWKSTLNLTNASNTTIVNGEDEETYVDDFLPYFSSSVSLTRTVPGYTISFKENMPTLVAINMCCLLDNAFVFFADKDGHNTMYYVCYGDDLPLASNPGNPSADGVVNIYPRMTSQYQNYTKFDLMMFKKLIGVSSKNSEGSETIVNNQIVVMNGGKGEAENEPSRRMYGDCAGAMVSSDLMKSYPYNGTNTCQIIADNLVKRYKDPTRSITITLSEVISNDNGSGWEQAIPTYTYARKIVDNVNNISLTNTHLCEPDTIEGETNPDKTDPFMLRLSTFIRAYPEFTSEYTFGVMKETTLSQELANKLTGMTGDVTDIRLSDGSSIVSDLGIVTVDSVLDGTEYDPPHLITSKGVYDAFNGAIINSDTTARDLTLVSSTDNTISGYPYKYSFVSNGVTEDYFVTITFGITEITAGNWASVCESSENKIYLFSNKSLSTPSVVCGFSAVKDIW